MTHDPRGRANEDDDGSDWIRRGRGGYQPGSYAAPSAFEQSPSGSSFAALRNEPVIAPLPETLLRHNARVLDPITAYQLPGQAPVSPTVYIADRLIVDGDATETVRQALTEAAAAQGLEVRSDVHDTQETDRIAEVARSVGVSRSLPSRIRLVPVGRAARPGPDAWSLLQTLRSELADNGYAGGHVTLDHLLTAASLPGYGGSAWAGHGVPSYRYALPGSNGRQPVSSPGFAPARRSDAMLRGRRPVVAIVDSPVGHHPWLGAGVDRRPRVLGLSVSDPEPDGLEGPESEMAAHGTFTAGVVRQYCPDADILAVGAWGHDGVVSESRLLDILWKLVIRQEVAFRSADPDGIIDVLTISAGFYHEEPLAGGVSGSGLVAVLDALGRLGVAVVAPAGNDATYRPMYPAACTPWEGGLVPAFDHVAVPLIGVGASNPNGEIASFSNAGPWVRSHRPGALVLSTLPTSMPTGHHPERRADADVMDFSGGFGLWGGTSFAAAALAGQLAAVIATDEHQSLDVPAAVARGWTAVAACVEDVRRP